MTATLDRSASRTSVPRVAGRSAAGRSPLGPGLVAAGWAVGAGLVILGFPVLLAWASDARSGAGSAEAVRSVGQLWLLAHGTTLTLASGSIGFTPLGLMLVPLALLHRAGRHGARTLEVGSPAQGLRLVVAVAFPYALAGAVLSAASSTAAVRPAPVGALIGTLVVGLLGAGSGVLRESGLGARGLASLPPVLRRALTGVLGASAVLLAGGALLAAVMLLRHAGRASALAAASDPGVVGGLTLLAVGVLCVPNAAVWGASWLAGPGFAVGVGTAVGPLGTTLGAVPAVPLLAALPSAPAPTWSVLVAGLVPVAAGVVGGLLMTRGRPRGAAAAAREGLLLGPCTGAVWAGLCYLSGGPLGGARLAAVGPSPWQVGVVLALEVGLAASACAAVARR